MYVPHRAFHGRLVYLNSNTHAYDICIQKSLRVLHTISMVLPSSVRDFVDEARFLEFF